MNIRTSAYGVEGGVSVSLSAILDRQGTLPVADTLVPLMTPGSGRSVHSQAHNPEAICLQPQS